MNAQNIIKEIVCENGKHLGDLVGWSCHGTHDQNKVSQVARDNDLDRDIKFPKQNASSEYRKALVKATTGKRGETKISVTKLEDTIDYIVHAISAKNLVDDHIDTLSRKDVNHQTVLKIHFDKKAALEETKDKRSLITYSDPYHPVANHIRSEYEQAIGVYDSNEIRIAFQRAFESFGAIRLLSHGGLWWVPAPYSHKIRSWVNFMADLNYTSLVIPVFDTEETIQALTEQSQNTLETQLAEMIEELKVFGDRDNLRPSTLTKRVAKFDSLRATVELHAKVLNLKSTELLERLNTAQNDLVYSISNPAPKTEIATNNTTPNAE